MIFDLHCDTASVIYKAGLKGENVGILKNAFDIDYYKLQKGKVGFQCFACCVTKSYKNPFETYCKIINNFKNKLSECNGKIEILKKYSDFTDNANNGIISAVLTMEDGAPISGDIEKLSYFSELGVKMIALTWNNVNDIGYPNCYKGDGVTPETELGLTDFGFEVVKKMNKLGMIVDVSHLSDKGFYDVIKTTDKPIVASHSNARSVCPHLRNITDDMLYKLADNGGTVGINFYPPFISEGADKYSVEGVIKHIDYIKNLIGVNHISLGSDFDGINEKNEICSSNKYGILTDALIKNGYKVSEIEKITSENALRVFKANIK